MRTFKEETAFIKAKKSDRLKSRIWELDFLRGICILLMVFDHFCFSVAEIFGPEWRFSGFGEWLVGFSEGYLTGNLREIFHDLIVFLFMFICGISCTFSKSNFKRGFLMIFLSLGISLVTLALGMPIYFGVLHMLTVMILVYALIGFITRYNRNLTALICFILGTVMIFLNNLYLERIIQVDTGFMGIFFAEGVTAGYNADYFPLMPFGAYVLLGAAAGMFIYKKRKSLLPFLDRYRWYRPVNFVGRHGLFVYCAHQVIIVILLAFVSVVWATPGDFIII